MPPGLRICNYGKENDPHCDVAPVFHVLWLEDNMVSGACKEHMAFIFRTASNPYEVHDYMEHCGKEGAIWHHPAEDEEQGYCYMPEVPDDLSTLALELANV